MSKIIANFMGENNIIRKRLWICCIVSFIGIYASIAIPQIAIVIFLFNIITFLFFNEQEIFCELMFLVPFTMVYKLNPASTSLCTYLTLVGTIVLLFKYGKINRKIMLLTLIMAVYMIFGMKSSYTNYLKLLANIILVTLFIQLIKRENFSKVFLSLSIGMILSSIIGLRKSTWTALASFFSNMKEEYIDGSAVYRFTGLYLDPNYFSITVIVCLLGIICYLYLKEIDFKIGIPIIMALVVFGCLTYSRIFYICLIIILAITLILRIKMTKKIGSSILIFLMLIMLGLYFAWKNGIIDNILYRFSASDISNNRFDIWQNYLTYIGSNVKSLFLGVGIGGSYYNDVGPHNFYIEIVYFLGLIGGFIYFTIYAILLNKKQNQYMKRGFFNYIMIFVIMIMFATLGMLFSNDFPFLIMVGWIFMNTNIYGISLKESN